MSPVHRSAHLIRGREGGGATAGERLGPPARRRRGTRGRRATTRGKQATILVEGEQLPRGKATARRSCSIIGWKATARGNRVNDRGGDRKATARVRKATASGNRVNDREGDRRATARVRKAAAKGNRVNDREGDRRATARVRKAAAKGNRVNDREGDRRATAIG